jgi:electron transport complex protein RnfE
MGQLVQRLKVGIFKENPIFIQMLGMCPTLAVTTSAYNGFGMGMATSAVLICSNLVISLLRKIIPSKVRIPAYIVIIATFVTIIEFLLEGFVYNLYEQLGLFIPLIVVNCVILGRAESFASKNKVVPSIFDGLGMGLGFTVALTLIGFVRESLGAFVSIFGLAPGAFFVVGFLLALFNFIQSTLKKEA